MTFGSLVEWGVFSTCVPRCPGSAWPGIVPQGPFDDFCRFALASLDDRGTRHLVSGGLAVMVGGEPRTTLDADAVVFVSLAEPEVLIRQAAEAGCEVREDVERQRRASTGKVRLRRGRFQIDLITASLPFEEAASRRASVHERCGRRFRFPAGAVRAWAAEVDSQAASRVRAPVSSPPRVMKPAMNPLARPALRVLALLVSGLSLGSTAGQADELPVDTNKIESLTVEQATALLAKFPEANVPFEIEGVGPQTLRQCLTLNGLKSVDAKTAEVLAGDRISPLFLDGLVELSEEAAKALAQHKRLLSLNGLTTLSDEAAKALAEHMGLLCLNGVTTLSDGAATALAQHKGDWLFLNGMTTLSDAAAEALAQNRGDYLSLNGLTTLSDVAAKTLTQYKGQNLYLNGLTTLSDAAAEALAKRGDRSCLYLSGLTTISDATAKALAQHNGKRLYLNGLDTLSDAAAKALGQHNGRALSLNGLTTLSSEAAESLAQHKGGLFLNGLTTLSNEAAESLAQHTGGLFLNGLTTLSGAAAKSLAKHKGAVSLAGLTTLSADAAEGLAAVEKWDGILLRLSAFDSPDSVAVARALATRKGPLLLPALKKISPKALSVLLEKKDVEIPLVETLEFVPEPDGSTTEDFIIPEWLEEREKQRRAARATE